AMKMIDLGRELFDFLYANAPADFLSGFLHQARVRREASEEGERA
ncbi:hypothetical protein LCGC14_2692070, partial [marine sediment metagenome]